MLTGAHVARWAEQAAAGLAEHKDEINELNVFPIPDSDTGSNMTATMGSAVERMHQDHGKAGSQAVAATSVADVAASLAAGAVTGARGNSGLVLSQFLRALADSAAATGKDSLSAGSIPGMLHRAEKLVRRAVSEPVEGTIISVLHAAAEASSAIVAEREGTSQDGSGLTDLTAVDIARAARDAAAKALTETTAQLPALASAGVVDAGGRGLVVILDALADALEDALREGHADTSSQDDGSQPDEEIGAQSSSQQGAERTAGAEIEVMFTLRATEEHLDTLRGELNTRGNSVVIVPGESDGTWRVHVHTTAGGPLIELAFATGEVTDLALEALPVVEPAEEERPSAPVLALVPEGGLRGMFATAGATAGDTATVIAEFERRGTGCIVLTNGQDTAELFGRLASSDGEATVVDTESFVGGLAAMAVYSPTADLDENAEEMADAVSAQRWIQEDSDGSTDTADGAAALADLVTSMVSGLLADGGELVTVLYDLAGDVDGDGASDPAASDLAASCVEDAVEALRAEHPGVELHSYRVPGLGTDVQVGVE
ncbi:DAK2 domain-containing protein [Corynebacterium sp. AOP40-9SA-29]|uniref:DAK2 domain-containing protein n=1 Tax=Corynebacterium sp. AOP40-9SA-29 TaxID=3457677 RepID=UPI004034E6D8